MDYINILSKYDLVIDNYEIQMITGLTQTISFMVDNKPILTDVFINGKCLTGNIAIKMLSEICADDLRNVQLVSRHPISRKRRSDRRKDYDFCPALRTIKNMIDGIEDEELSRYDNKINSELLPDYKITLDSIYHDELAPVELMEAAEDISPYTWDENGIKQTN